MAQKTNVKGNVLVCGPETDKLETIFGQYGYAAWVWPVEDITGVDFQFVAFPGGIDVNPKLYGQQPHWKTHFANSLDIHEISFYHKYKHLKKLGVCRGGQLLNVLNGGTLWQDVNNHNDRHYITDWKNRSIHVSSVHHQMMRPAEDGVVLAWTKRATIKTDDKTHKTLSHPEEDPEVIFYPKDQALCFQPHPEYGPDSCTDYFFQLIEEHLS